MEEAEDKFGSKAKANAGLTLGIIGTALSCLGGLGAVGGAPLGQNFSGITEQYYQGQISNIREIYDMYKILDNKIVDSSFALYKNQRDEKDALSDRIARLETKQAVADAVEPWRNQVLQMQIAGETANRQFAE
jgi:hypothetical protein